MHAKLSRDGAVNGEHNLVRDFNRAAAGLYDDMAESYAASMTEKVKRGGKLSVEEISRLLGCKTTDDMPDEMIDTLYEAGRLQWGEVEGRPEKTIAQKRDELDLHARVTSYRTKIVEEPDYQFHADDDELDKSLDLSYPGFLWHMMKTGPVEGIKALFQDEAELKNDIIPGKIEVEVKKDENFLRAIEKYPDYARKSMPVLQI